MSGNNAGRKILFLKYKGKQRKLMLLVFACPAFLPLLFNFLCVWGGNNYDDFFLFLENVEVIRYANTVLDDTEHKCNLASGYLFSFLYIFLITPYIYSYQIDRLRMGFRLNRRVNKYLMWFCFLCLCLFVYLNLFDISTGGSERVHKLIELSFYMWPLFFMLFIFPVYMFLFLFIFWLVNFRD
ncbi:hypothetical protein Q4601_20365 [Shewanella sp. 1_MG-2023]|uniref:hypothetical protein n=1 Tax=unclassified Shewanella TaxID=196818 RepID=UPI0026E31B2B|nr:MULTISPECIES: hypothetical protein [unclassified Shewanella]MDO6613028.1 hypothetical protein [Shewanella sp. 7_MG-2023]MDO6772896.1 hypothetical protein [Shewanella sp. 2_MG-2023]MDO6796650.1 hypothetical protein [Shewanella sp. 1_MG-2023]